MHGIDTDQFGAVLQVRPAQLAHTGLQYLESQLSAGTRARAGVRDLGVANESISVAQGHFECVGLALSGRPLDLDAIGAAFLETHAGEVGHDVGLQVRAGVFDFIQQLGGAGQTVDATAGAVELSDQGLTIGRHVGERESDVGQVRNIDVTGVGDVATADLRRTLQQMPHDDALAHLFPVVCGPSEVVHQWCKKQRRIGYAASNDDIRSAAQRRQQGVGAEIGVGRDQIPVQATYRLIGLHQRHVVVAHPLQDVVPLDHGDLQSRQSEFSRHVEHRMSGCQRVGGPHVGDDGDTLCMAGRQYGAHALLEQRVVTQLRVGAAAQLGQGDGAFGQAFEYQRVELAPFGQILGRVDAVTGITGAGTYAKWLHGAILHRPRASAAIAIAGLVKDAFSDTL